MRDTLFPHFADDARLWVYVADRLLDQNDTEALRDHLDTFFGNWASHGRPVEGAARVVADRFVLVAAQLRDGDISGCGIDASTNALDEVAAQLGLEWLPALSVAYRDQAGRVQVLPRPAFRRAVRDGAVTADTPVFDTGLTTVDELRVKGFEKPAGESWHARVFRIPVLAQ